MFCHTLVEVLSEVSVLLRNILPSFRDLPLDQELSESNTPVKHALYILHFRYIQIIKQLTKEKQPKNMLCQAQTFFIACEVF